MSKPLVLITGATGHIGFRTLAKVLEAGYRARVSSRKLSSAEHLKELPSIKPYADLLEPVEVPDFLAKGAFDKAVQGVDYILHLASPLPDSSKPAFDLDDDYIQPAIQGTVGILESASKSPTVKRVVITSTIAVIALHDRKMTIGPNDAKPVPSRAEMSSNPWLAYAGSKILAQDAADKYIADNKPAYDTLFVLPGYVQGHNETLTTAQQLYDGPSSNHTMVQYVTGTRFPMPVPANFVHLDDVAAAHVAALAATDVVNGERFTVSPPPLENFHQINEVVKKLFPDEVKSGLIPLGEGEQAISSAVYETENTSEKLLQREFLGLESMVQSLVGQYIELLKKEKGQ